MPCFHRRAQEPFRGFLPFSSAALLRSLAPSQISLVGADGGSESPLELQIRFLLMKRRRSSLLRSKTLRFVYVFYFGKFGQSCLSINQPEVEQEEESFLLISLDEVKAFYVGLAASRAGRLPVQSPPQPPRTRTPCQHETFGKVMASLCHGHRSACMLQSFPFPEPPFAC